METFAETGLKVEIIEAVTALGFEKPTPIQAKAIPQLISSDQDLIAFAQTGTGKTAAFGLPSVHKTDISSKLTQTIVLCPTRELCLQIAKDLDSYATNLRGLNVLAVYGGASIDPQIKALNRGAQIVVGTPGRVKDLIKRKRLKLENIERVVLDEADEMLTMGFKEELDFILAETPEFKQTMLFSATMPREIAAITKKYMNQPAEISASRQNTGAENVEHIYYMVQAKDRYEVLKRISDMNPNIYGIVFCRTRRETKEIANKLMHDGYNADALHGDLSQAQRDEVMGRFRSKHLQLLVATDVAARGLDVKEMTHVINFNLPDEAEVYIHRSGRTGRAGKSGTSIAIAHTRESGKIRTIEKKSGKTFTKGVVPTGKDICEKQLLTLIDKIEKVEVDQAQIEPFLPAIIEKLDWLSREDLIKHFVSAEFNRFLTYYKNAQDINVSEGRRSDRSDRSERGERGERGERSRRGERRERSERGGDRSSGGTKYSRFFINVGNKNELNPARLMGLVNEGLNSSDAQIGKIEIMKKFSFFEVDSTYENEVMNGLQGKEFEGISLSIELSKDKPSGGRRDDRSESRGFQGNRRSEGSRGGHRKGGGGDRRRR